MIVVRHHGMTLLELLVAMAIFSLVATAGYAGLQQGLSVQERLQQQRAFWQRLESVFVLLQGDLDQVSGRVPRTPVQELPAFAGVNSNARSADGQLFEFTRGGIASFAEGPVSPYQRIAWRLRNGQLYRASWARLDRLAGAQASEAPLLDGVAALQVRYLHPEQGWIGRWPQAVVSTEPPGLPLAVEFTLELQQHGTYQRYFHVGPPRS